MKIKRVVISLIIILLIAGVAIFAVIRKKKELSKAKALTNRPVPVSVVEIKVGEFVTSKRYVGVMIPLTTANISSRITSEIIEIYHREGENVKKGDKLLKLDGIQLEQTIAVEKTKVESVKTEIVANNVSVKSLKDSVAYWEKQVNRDDSLNEKNIISKKQLEQSREQLNSVTGRYNVALQRCKTLEALLASTQGALRLAEISLSYANIVAPFDCVVCDVPIDPGDLASPGKKLMLVENHNQLKVSIKIPQIDMRLVKIGEKIHVTSRTEKAIITITKIYPSVGVNKMVRIDAIIPQVDSNKFVSGQYVLVFLDSKVLKDALIVPSTAINIDNNKQTENAIFVVKDQILTKVPVNVISNNETSAAISGDIKPGDKVVVSAFLGWAKLSNGLKVTTNK